MTATTTRDAPDGLGRNIFGSAWTRGEILLATTASALVTVLLAGYLWHIGGWQDRTAVQVVVLAVIVVDLVAGIFTTSTAAASRWYHRPGPGARRFRLGFVAIHTGYLAVAAALLEAGWAWAAVNAALLVGAGLAIEYTPTGSKRAVALAVTLSAVLVNLIWLPLPITLAWLPMLLFVKVLTCFMVPGPTAAAAR